VNNTSESNKCDGGDLTRFRLYKKEKLCSQIAINQLFEQNADVHMTLAYPLRAVWRQNQRRHSDSPLQFLITVPKKRLKHAVDRVLVRRRVREAYRLLHQQFEPHGVKIDVAFIYVGKGITDYAQISRAMKRILIAVAKSVNTPSEKSNDV
jgi:ribonuclease P protein component